MAHKFPSRKLRVIIRDPAPLVVLSEPVAHRSVEIELTDEQLDKLRLRNTGVSCGNPLFEDISSVFFEEEP